MHPLLTYFTNVVALTEGEQAQLLAAFRPRRARAGDHLVRAGQVCRSITFVESGLLRYYYLVNGKEVTGNFFFESSFVGAFASFISQSPSKQFVDCLEDCVLWQATHEQLEQLYATVPALEKFGRKMAESLFVHAQNRTASLLLDTPDQRYANLLRNRPKVLQRVPQYMIASYLGFTPETLSRIRKRFAEQPDRS